MLSSIHHPPCVLPEAEGLYRRALAGREDQLGSTHPDTLNSVWNLAVLLEAKGSLTEARFLVDLRLAAVLLGSGHVRDQPGPRVAAPAATHHVQAGQLYLRELRGMEAAGSEGMVAGGLRGVMMKPGHHQSSSYSLHVDFGVPK
eukprot:s1011_g27.t2